VSAIVTAIIAFKIIITIELLHPFIPIFFLYLITIAKVRVIATFTTVPGFF